MSYFGDRPDLESDSMASHITRGHVEAVQGARGGVAYQPNLPKPMSFLRPMTPYGESYTPSYTRYLNAPGSSYTNPLFPLFNDRREQPKIRTTLRSAPPEEF